LYLLAALFLQGGLHANFPLAQWLSWPWRWIGLLFILKGVALAVAARVRFVKHGTPVRPFTRSTALVTDGPFVFTRNPMYIGVLLVLSGSSLLYGSLSPWLAVFVMWCVLNYLFIPREEACMRQLFGAAYQDYCARVNRWF